MQNADRWDVPRDEAHEPLPGHPVTLTSPPKRVQPRSIDLPAEAAEPAAVARNGVVVQIPLEYSPQPRTNHWNRLMASAQQGLTYRFHCGTHPLGRGRSFDGDLPVPSCCRANVREPKEVEHFGPAKAGPRAAFSCIATELQHPRLIVIQRQPELREPHPQGLEEA